MVPLWPQLAEILQPYMDRRVVEQGGCLLFPSPESVHAGTESMWQDSRKLLDRVARRAGWQKGEIRHRIFRHTYTAARLQTLDNGAPVSLYTVSRELGHGSQDMVERIYSHLGATRHRAAFIEFRLEQHVDAISDRLAQLDWVSAVTVPVTAELGWVDTKKPRAS